MNTRAFRSRIDPLLVGLVFIPLLGVCGLILWRATGHGEMPPTFVVITIALSIGLTAWIFASTSYRFTDSQLVVRSGPFRSLVPIEKIRRVTRTRTLQSAPALSLQRLELAYNTNDVVIISPADEAGFLKMLKAKVPDVRLP